MQNEEIESTEINKAPPSKGEVLNYLTALGVNSCVRRYDTESKEMYAAYLALPLNVLAETWDHLDSNVKVSILDSHLDEFKTWITGGAK
jgi:hypothetical protein|tara:strand:+ start:234 stop:500 length:267 start_codon:yes stop_codon:yes gene_type:complete